MLTTSSCFQLELAVLSASKKAVKVVRKKDCTVRIQDACEEDKIKGSKMQFLLHYHNAHSIDNLLIAIN